MRFLQLLNSLIITIEHNGQKYFTRARQLIIPRLHKTFPVTVATVTAGKRIFIKNSKHL